MRLRRSGSGRPSQPRIGGGGGGVTSNFATLVVVVLACVLLLFWGANIVVVGNSSGGFWSAKTTRLLAATNTDRGWEGLRTNKADERLKKTSMPHTTTNSNLLTITTTPPTTPLPVPLTPIDIPPTLPFITTIVSPAPNPDVPVSLRILIITGGTRLESTKRLLRSLQNTSNPTNDRLDLDLWVDVNPSPVFIHITSKFAWRFGQYSVHAWQQRAGLRRQWIDTWHLSVPGGLQPTTSERAVILEDDLIVSPYYWRWLKAAHNAYANMSEIAAYTLERARTCAAYCDDLRGGPRAVFAYKLLGTWGWSPKAQHMINFRKWYYSLPPDFKPYVVNKLPDGRTFGLVHTYWYKERELVGQEKLRIWSAHHVKYADTHHDSYTVYVKLPNEMTLAKNFIEAGLNYAPGLYNYTSDAIPCNGAWDCVVNSTCWPDGRCRDNHGCFTPRKNTRFAQGSAFTHRYEVLTNWRAKFETFPAPDKLPKYGWNAGRKWKSFLNTKEFNLNEELLRRSVAGNKTNPQFTIDGNGKMTVWWDPKISQYATVCSYFT